MSGSRAKVRTPASRKPIIKKKRVSLDDRMVNKAVSATRKGMKSAVNAGSASDSTATARNRKAMNSLMGNSGYTRGYNIKKKNR